MKTKRFLRSVAVTALSAALALAPAVVSAQTAVGETAKVVKKVTGKLDATTRDLVLKDMIYRNELISTAGDSGTQISFVDQTNLTVGPNSDLVIDEFVFDAGAADTAKFSMRMTKGVMRFVSGKMKKTAYAIRTPTATIGIRGTILTVTVALDGTTTLSVAEGTATISSGGATQSVAAGQSSTVSSAGGVPTQPGPTPPGHLQQVASLDSTLGSTGGIAGSQAAAAGFGGLGAGAIAAGVVVAAAAALAIAAAVSDDEDTVSSSTSTSTSTSTNGGSTTSTATSTN